jgi:very-short-patch-repair endonuclease
MRRGGDVDRAIAALASANNRVVTWSALTAAGVGRRAVQHRVAVGRLHRVHHGVYLLEPPRSASRIALLTAAVAACGSDAVLSHRSAAELWGLTPRSHPGEIEITVIATNRRKRRGIRQHRAPALDPRDIRTRHGIRVTSPARTVLDAASYLHYDDLEELVAEALATGLVDARKLQGVIARYPSRRGIGRLLEILGQDGGPRRSRSRNERRLLALVRQAGLPVPITNTLLHGHQVDALWPEHKLVVEIDGWETHRDRAAFENDRARDAAHVANGYRVLRFTARQLRDQPLTVIARLSAALAQSAPLAQSTAQRG